MLVLSRQPNQSIVFPTLGVSVQVLSVAGQTARIGVQAPRSIPVLREELVPAGEAASLPTAAGAAGGTVQRARHRLRGRLNTATIALYLAQRQLQSDRRADADVTLQRALDELSRLEGELASEGAPPHRPDARPRIRTLLVEDNPHESALLESYLRLSGLEVDSASDGQEALDYLSSHEPPDAILLDMRLPRCDGPAMVAAVRSNPTYNRLKIYAVSGARPEEVHMPTGPKGVDHWFTKPLNPARLVDTLTASVG